MQRMLVPMLLLATAANAHGSLKRSTHSPDGHSDWCGTKNIAPKLQRGERATQNDFIFPPNSACNPNTLCDIPDVIVGYRTMANDLQDITLNYYVYNLANNDGSNKLISDSDLLFQNQVMNDSFAPHGLGWISNEILVQNTVLRNKIATPFCPLVWIGDGECDNDCNTIETGFDGGDCGTDYTNHKAYCQWGAGTYFNSQSACDNAGYCTRACEPVCDWNAMPGNGVCNPGCNFYHPTASKAWDGGDCCTQTERVNCRDSSSSYRNFEESDSLKTDIANAAGYTVNNPPSGMSVYVTQLAESSLLLGYATFPWDDIVHTIHGGVWFRKEAWGNFPASSLTGVTAVHEIGHCMGLYHVFTGTDEISSCADPCYEGYYAAPAYDTGDLCADTNPSPTIYGSCQQPCACGKTCNYVTTSCDACANVGFTSAPATNFMNYGDDDCLNKFTADQQARMRCYVDLIYEDWRAQPVTVPSPIVISPFANSLGDTSVTLGIELLWMEPFANPGGITYVIERTPAFTNTVTTNTNSYIDSAVTAGVKYKYRVTAENSNGESVATSPYSNERDPSEPRQAGTAVVPQFFMVLVAVLACFFMMMV